MQIDAETAAIIGGLSSIASAFVGYGIMLEKVRKLESDLEETKEQMHDNRAELKQEQSRFVTLQHFDAVVGPIRHTLDSVQVDIKVLLKMFSKQ